MQIGVNGFSIDFYYRRLNSLLQVSGMLNNANILINSDERFPAEITTLREILQFIHGLHSREDDAF